MALNEFENAVIHVDAPGMYTTVQDAGRVGYQQYGMPVAGPMAVSYTHLSKIFFLTY